jgi:hypothetical protein
VPIDDLLERADAARVAGRLLEVGRLYDEGSERAGLADAWMVMISSLAVCR